MLAVLPTLPRYRLRRMDLLLLVSYIALGFLFFLRGNMSQTEFFGHSAFRWMIARWHDTVSYGGVDYSHGWVIPLVSLWLVLRRRTDLADAEKDVDPVGLVPLVLGFLLHYVGLQVAQTRISLFALGMMLWSLPCYLYGRRVGGILLFPCIYLGFCIPLNFLNVLTFPLRLLATSVAAGLLNGINVGCVRSGTTIALTAREGCVLNVADPCSGLRSLLAIAAITAAYGYVSQRRAWKQWVLFLLAVPLAIIGNIARIVTIALVALAFGVDLALHLYHDYSGYFVFVIVVLIMLGVGRLLEKGLSLRAGAPDTGNNGSPEQ